MAGEAGPDDEVGPDGLEPVGPLCAVDVEVDLLDVIGGRDRLQQVVGDAKVEGALELALEEGVVAVDE